MRGVNQCLCDMNQMAALLTGGVLLNYLFSDGRYEKHMHKGHIQGGLPALILQYARRKT